MKKQKRAEVQETNLKSSLFCLFHFVFELNLKRRQIKLGKMEQEEDEHQSLLQLQLQIFIDTCVIINSADGAQS